MDVLSEPLPGMLELHLRAFDDNRGSFAETYNRRSLAEVGIDSHFQTKVGDNADRMRASIDLALSRSDAVILCGGLGPTQDDITRNVIADVMVERVIDLFEVIHIHGQQSMLFAIA